MVDNISAAKHQHNTLTFGDINGNTTNLNIIHHNVDLTGVARDKTTEIQDPQNH